MLRPALPPWATKAREFAARAGSPSPFRAAKKGSRAEVYLYDAIGRDPWTETGIDPADVVKAVADAKGAEALDVHINSPGGFVFDGMAIFNAIRSFAGPKTVYVDGVAASIASIIAMAGDRVVVNEGAMFMIHDPMGGIYTMGTADEIEEASRREVSALRKVRENLIDVYVTATGRSVSEVSAWMADETWMTADESAARGFADEVVKQAPAVTSPAAVASIATPAVAGSPSPQSVAALARAQARDLSERFPRASPGAVPGQPVNTNRTPAR